MQINKTLISFRARSEVQRAPADTAPATSTGRGYVWIPYATLRPQTSALGFIHVLETWRRAAVYRLVTHETRWQTAVRLNQVTTRKRGQAAGRNGSPGTRLSCTERRAWRSLLAMTGIGGGDPCAGRIHSSGWCDRTGHVSLSDRTAACRASSYGAMRLGGGARSPSTATNRVGRPGCRAVQGSLAHRIKRSDRRGTPLTGNCKYIVATTVRERSDRIQLGFCMYRHCEVLHSSALQGKHDEHLAADICFCYQRGAI
ncbi:hypothetical protein PC116_g12007 [Phytophthora cactorum]|uniref:Uncharacterized protein n=1 Tax=Phytophthora cactorum TaxID=29920 RepID=A0A8T1BHD8_9STRA|nr:hypothetical protein Pcac1_g23465 [Phytophthora cactorum]KAG2903797.1 hypothetical protein PC117_g21183 [Phytophthora cactorum]KAG2916502.1 hypothetical protein PC114_g7457 [Phytophthora cactorum]KAG2981569.1 hypothetical protein PC119_g20987 [Phytophthora cactorum]KAG3001092.1 hypothetical protein PC120_g20490 [Phytophthora cactorum]